LEDLDRTDVVRMTALETNAFVTAPFLPRKTATESLPRSTIALLFALHKSREIAVVLRCLFQVGCEKRSALSAERQAWRQDAQSPQSLDP